MTVSVPKWNTNTKYYRNQLADVAGLVYAANGEFTSCSYPVGYGHDIPDYGATNITPGDKATWDFFAESLEGKRGTWPVYWSRYETGTGDKQLASGPYKWPKDLPK